MRREGSVFLAACAGGLLRRGKLNGRSLNGYTEEQNREERKGREVRLYSEPARYRNALKSDGLRVVTQNDAVSQSTEDYKYLLVEEDRTTLKSEGNTPADLVMALDFHPKSPALLSVGLYDGTVLVFDVRNKHKRAIY